MTQFDGTPERRGSARHEAEICCVLETRDGAMEVTLQNMSTDGILFRCPVPIEPNAQIRLSIPGLGPRTLQVIRINKEQIGAVFDVPLTCCDVADALLEKVVVSDAF